MNYKTLLPSLVLMIAAPGALVASDHQILAEPLVIGPDVEITAQDLVYELQAYPRGRQRLIVNDEGHLRDLINGMYRRARINAWAREQRLLEDPVIAYRVARAAEQALSDIAHRHYTDNMEMPDFTRLARERYENALSRYLVPERVRAAHILLAASDEDARAERRAEAEALLARAREGEDFASLARDHSEDEGSAATGGDLGAFSRGRMVPPFEEAAFGLEAPGEISEVVETRFGLHLIKLLEREPEHHRPFEEVKDEIIATLREEYLRTETTAWIREVTDPADSHFDQAVFDEILHMIREQLNRPE